MTNSKLTKRALLTSVMALFLCVAMLTGTTFAWFTDTVTSSGNKIVAGNLDVQLLMNTGSGYADISDSTDPIFGAGSIAQNNNAETLWEPGKTQIAYLGIRNAGNLALKYNVIVDVTDNELVGALEYAIIPLADENATVYGANWNEIKANAGASYGDLAAGRFIAAPNGCLDEVRNGYDPNNLETDYFALAIHMKEEADNKFMSKSVTIDITVAATQVTAESDSINDQYDNNSEYPVSITLSAPVTLDGANKLQRVWHIDLPSIMPTIIILLVMSCGSIIGVGYEKVYLMQNSVNMDVSEVISTYVYKVGIENQQYSFSTAVGLLNNVVNFTLLTIVNKTSDKLSGISLW